MTIAGSAGAFHPLAYLIEKLPATLESAVIAMLHTGPRSLLAETLGSRSHLSVRSADTGDVLSNGCVYVPQPRMHLVVNPDGRITLSHAPPLRRFRPSADWLFESAAASFRDRHIAVVLSGMLSDGARRIRAVKRAGGTVLVQSPVEAQFPDMPNAAIKTGCVDAILPVDGLVPAICDAVDRCNAAALTDAW